MTTIRHKLISIDGYSPRKHNSLSSNGLKRTGAELMSSVVSFIVIGAVTKSAQRLDKDLWWS